MDYTDPGMGHFRGFLGVFHLPDPRLAADLATGIWVFCTLTAGWRISPGHPPWDRSLDILHIPSGASTLRKGGACRQGLAPKARSIPAQGNPAKREPPWVAGAKSSAALQGRRPMVLRPADATADGAKAPLCRGWRAENGLRPCRAPVPLRILTQGGALPPFGTTNLACVGAGGRCNPNLLNKSPLESPEKKSC